MGDVPAFYERPGLNSETYDARLAAEEADRKPGGDISFYAELAAAGEGNVLELGCGTGRVAVALAEMGYNVVGLDLSMAMLKQAEAKRAQLDPLVAARLHFVHEDMTRFTLPERFGLAIAPFHAFQALLESQQQRDCLMRVREHLRPRGVIALDLFDPRLHLCVPGGEDRFLGLRAAVAHPATGRDIRISVISRENDPLRQRFVERWLFEELDRDGNAVRVEEERLALRWSYRWEMRYLLELCGYVVEAEYSDFKRSPPAYGLEQVWLARRPA